MSDLLDGLFGSSASAQAFSTRAHLAGMLHFEAGLARAQASLGLIPVTAAQAIERHCDPAGFDTAALSAAAGLAGNLAIPLVSQLTALVAAQDVTAARYVHWGATSQDAIDTGLVLQLREVLGGIEADLDRLCAALALQTERHRLTVLAGRTWLQQASPTTLGLKLAGFLEAMLRHRRRLRAAREAALVLQFGGAVGNLAALGEHALPLCAALATELDIPAPLLPWHSQRDRLVDLACALAMLTGTLGKLGRDISLLMQTEIAEAGEPSIPGRGGSSTMPQKRNPVACAVALAAAQRVPGLLSTLVGAMVQEQERGLGGWHAEWETLPELVRLSAGALGQMATCVEGLQVDAPRMHANLEADGGLLMAEAVSMALALHLGKSGAHQVMARCSGTARSTDRSLREMLGQDPDVREHLDDAALDALVDPAAYVGAAGALVDRVLEQARAEA